MKVGLYGVNFANKGAELMLHAVLAELQQWPQVEHIVLGPGVGNRAGARQLGLGHVALWRKRWRDFPLPIKWCPDHYVAEAELDVILDASGFAYGDQWGPQALHMLARQLRRWHTPGKRYILLPQALGPFEQPAVRAAFAQIAPQLARIYARDEQSLLHVQQACASATASQIPISQAPDFTATVPAATIAPRWAQHVCLVPNQRMVDKTTTAAADAYTQFLRHAITWLTARNVPAFWLLHDRDLDTALVQQLNAQLPTPLPVVQETDPLILKGIIGHSRLLIGARYHALVSALAQYVPVVATSWSHKYAALLEDYACPEQLLMNLTDTTAVEHALTQAFDAADNGLQARITAAATVQQVQITAFWQALRTELGG